MHWSIKVVTRKPLAFWKAVQESHPRNAEISAKLRAVRSLVTEQTYIEGLTQAAEGAKLARNQLRCTRLADIAACDDALKSKPDDVQLLLAKGDALLQANRPTDAVAAYQHASGLKPGDEAVKTKLAAAEALQANIPPAPATRQPEVVGSNTAHPVRTPKKAPVTHAALARGRGQEPTGRASRDAVSATHWRPTSDGSAASRRCCTGGQR